MPISTLPDDYYDYEEAQHALIGRRWNRVFRLGAKVRVRVTEADPLTGSTVFALVDASQGAEPEGLPPLDGTGRRGRPRESRRGPPPGARRRTRR